MSGTCGKGRGRFVQSYAPTQVCVLVPQEKRDGLAALQCSRGVVNPYYSPARHISISKPGHFLKGAASLAPAPCRRFKLNTAPTLQAWPRLRRRRATSSSWTAPSWAARTGSTRTPRWQTKTIPLSTSTSTTRTHTRWAAHCRDSCGREPSWRPHKREPLPSSSCSLACLTVVLSELSPLSVSD